MDFGIWVLLIVVGILSPMLIVLDYDELRANHVKDRCRTIYQKISNQKPKKNSFKNLQYLKRLLKNKHSTNCLVDDVISVHKWAWIPPVSANQTLHEAKYLWEFTQNRQLFNKKELKAIDRGNATIEEKLKPYKNIPTRAEIMEEQNKTVRWSRTAVDPIENRMSNDLSDSTVTYKFS